MGKKLLILKKLYNGEIYNVCSKSIELTEGEGIQISEDFMITNTGVREIHTGQTNGTISVNTNGVNENVQVKGLKSAAYTESTDYATSDHDHDNDYASREHTHSDFVKSGSGAKSGLVPAPSTTAGTTKYLREDGTWQVPPDNNTVYTHPTSSGNKHIPSGGSSGQILKWSSDGTAEWGSESGASYSDATTSSSGLMSASDKTKLNGIESGAQVNNIYGIKGNSESSYRTGYVNITPTNIGAASASHSHSEYASSSHSHSEYASSSHSHSEYASSSHSHSEYASSSHSHSGYASSSHTHYYAGSSSIGGAATSANKINTDAGSANTPVYFSGGVPAACTKNGLNLCVHSATGTSNTAGYIKIASITIKNTYANAPIIMAFARRSNPRPIIAYLRFLNTNNTDPGIETFYLSAYAQIYICKNSTSNWDIYIQKSDGNDNISVLWYSIPEYMQSRVAITWTNGQVTDPSSVGSTRTKAVTYEAGRTTQLYSGAYSTSTNLSVTGLWTRYKVLLIIATSTKYGTQSYVITTEKFSNGTALVVMNHGTINTTGPMLSLKRVDDNTVQIFDVQTSSADTYSKIEIYVVV